MSPRPHLPSVLFLHPSAESNGQDRALVQLVAAVDRKRWRPVVVLPRRGPLISALERAGATIEIGPIGAVKNGFAPFSLVGFLARLPLCLLFLWRMILRHRPALVHTHTTAVIGGALAARLFAKEHLWHIHAHLDPSRLGDRSTAMLLHLLADGVVCGSSASREAVLSVRPSLDMRVRVVRNALHANRYRAWNSAERAAMRAELGIDDSTTLVVMVGRVAPDHGHHLLVDAARKTVALHPYTQFVMVGDTDPRFRGFGATIDRAIVDAQLEGVVRRIAFDGDLESLYAAADLVCDPSPRPDPVHMVALEALAAGRPLVTASAPGRNEFMSPGTTGLLFQAGDAEELTWCLSSLIGSPERRGAMGAAAIDLHAREFQAGRFRNEFDRAWSQLVDREFILPTGRARVIHLVLGKANPHRANGVNHVVHHLATAQVASGLDAAVWGITEDPEAPTPDRRYELRLFRPGWSRFRLHADLQQAIASLDATAVIHIHGAFLPQMCAAAAQARRRKVPYVVTPHGAYRNETLRASPLRRGAWLRLLERRMLRGARAVQALSGREVTEMKGQLRGVRAHVIPNGQAAVGHHVQAADAGDVRRPVFAYCGRLAVHTKGLDALLEGFTSYAVARGNGTLWIVGEGDARESLERQAEDLGIGRRVSFFGGLYDEEKHAQLLAADAFIHPSRHEGMPTAVLEAGALGLPLLITPGTNLDDDVEVAGAGIVIPETTAEAIADALFEAERQHVSGELAASGARAAKLVEQRFAWPWIAAVMARELYELDDELCPAVPDLRAYEAQHPPPPALGSDPGRDPRPRRSA